jgi:hypothetical protein
MAANHMGHHAGFGRELDSLGKVTRRDFDRMTARYEFGYQRVKEWDVRRVGEIDPDAH